MKRPGSPFILSVAVAGLMFVACGGGGGNVGGGGMMGGGLTATFTPDVTMPAANSITMSAGTAAGDTFQIDIRVTDVVDFFGTAFSLRFDPATAEFQSFDGGASLLQAYPDFEIRADLDQVDAGLVAILATLNSPVGGPLQGGIDTSAEPTDLLLTLTFRATNPTGGANVFSVDAVRMREIRTCPAPPAACTTIPDAMVGWNGGTMTAM